MVPETQNDPRRARREAKISAILTEAWQLAERDGLALISLRDLASAVDLRQPSLYVYFASKLDLYDAMFADGYRQLIAYLDTKPLPAEPRAAVEHFVAENVRFVSRYPVVHQLLFQRTIPGFAPSPASREVALQFYSRAQAVLADVDADHQDDIDIFSSLVAGLCDQQIANDPGGDRWVQHVPRVVTMFLDSTVQSAT
ncbi:TetR/AcrR family transcriptional regulator [Rhodococcoides fascians]|uniref:TetR/AcrR family transcriptional regulator n=1 Tax=Rhodococcoides fascians TaxID=1828 RepID=UPI00056CACCD|nr:MULTISPECIES: TetR/AcrR family transcriptional regulator [Rhodococcus]OZE96521.1 TetR/AcrR family transcriptional regulator [Rhodococcus sp. 15-1189-1-1a]OZF11568.1 TetR/AcrR family transcriptional regulator [Rhodococcus sp. 14-2686-1-2]